MRYHCSFGRFILIFFNREFNLLNQSYFSIKGLLYCTCDAAIKIRVLFHIISVKFIAFVTQHSQVLMCSVNWLKCKDLFSDWNSFFFSINIFVFYKAMAFGLFLMIIYPYKCTLNCVACMPLDSHFQFSSFRVEYQIALEKHVYSVTCTVNFNSLN